MKIVDLHVHSNKSDGTYSPTALVDYAMEKGLSAFALTDHDTVDGLDEAISYADSLRTQFGSQSGAGSPCSKKVIPEIIPGIELSTEYEGKDIHIVGLYIDHKNQAFQESLQTFADSRTGRNLKMCENLRQADMDITYEALVQEFPNSVITRAHYAKWMLKHGYVKSMQEAFDRYVGDHCPYYVPREKVTPAQAIQLILQADGIPVLAHPTLYHLGKARLERLLLELKEAGLLAMEGIYSAYSTSEQRQMCSLAKKHGLLISGGSDFHGDNKPGLDLGRGYGRLLIPIDILTALQAARKHVLFTDMDGTLLLNNSEISPEMYAGITAYTAAGNHLVLTSGRPLPAILEVQKSQKLNLPGSQLVIAYNGALIYDCAEQKALAGYRLSREDVRYVSAEAAKWGLHIHTYSEDHIIAKNWNEELEFYTRRIHMPISYTDDLANALTDGPYKIQCIHLTDHQKLEDFRAHLMPRLGNHVNMLFSNEKYLELLPINAGKGQAITYVRNYLHLPLSHSYAAGDEENDISMLLAAGHGIAMANAAEHVKKAAEIITEKDNDHDGLLEIIHKIC